MVDERENVEGSEEIVEQGKAEAEPQPKEETGPMMPVAKHVAEKQKLRQKIAEQQAQLDALTQQRSEPTDESPLEKFVREHGPDEIAPASVHVEQRRYERTLMERERQNQGQRNRQAEIRQQLNDLPPDKKMIVTLGSLHLTEAQKAAALLDDDPVTTYIDLCEAKIRKVGDPQEIALIDAISKPGKPKAPAKPFSPPSESEEEEEGGIESGEKISPTIKKFLGTT